MESCYVRQHQFVELLMELFGHVEFLSYYLLYSSHWNSIVSTGWLNWDGNKIMHVHLGLCKSIAMQTLCYILFLMSSFSQNGRFITVAVYLLRHSCSVYQRQQPRRKINSKPIIYRYCKCPLSSPLNFFTFKWVYCAYESFYFYAVKMRCSMRSKNAKRASLIHKSFVNNTVGVQSKMDSTHECKMII